MSAPEAKPAAGAAAAPKREAYEELAERIFIGVAAQVYGHPTVAGQQRPEPKAVAAMCFKLAEAFEQASKETDRAKARIEAANKASVKLDDVDLSGVFASTGKK
jgi:hypothetical protein